MTTFSALILAAVVSILATTLTTGAIFLAFGHVQNDRQSCLQLDRGECGLRWEPLL